MQASPSAVADAIVQSCLDELAAPKPGNVHIFAPGHDMECRQFEASAHAIAPKLCDQSLTIGRRILGAVEATRAAAGCNTNLGIILLCAPLAAAALEPGSGSLKRRVKRVLIGLTAADATAVFQAIALASPGGLGDRSDHDVRNPTTIGLLDAMGLVADTDSVARQYVSGFADVLGMGIRRAHFAAKRWPDCPWARALSVYLKFLGTVPDSHILRKYGPAPLPQVMRVARGLDRMMRRAQSPDKLIQKMLLADSDFKNQRINPGTSADLTVSSLLAVRLMAIIGAGN